MCNKTENQNKGFTLIEMVLTLTIMAVLAGIVTIGVVSSTSKRDDEATILALSDLLETSRFSAMANKNGMFKAVIYYDPASGYHFLNVEDSEITVDEKIGGIKKIFYVNIEDSSGVVENAYEIDTLELTYDKATGCFKELNCVTPDGSSLPQSEIDDIINLVSQILV